VISVAKKDLSCMFKKLTIACLIVSLCRPRNRRDGTQNICRIKGQDENVLRGIGLWLGSTERVRPNDGPTDASTCQGAGNVSNRVATPDAKQSGLDELRRRKTRVLVMVTATVPATGRRGAADKVDCSVRRTTARASTAVSWRFASLMGPNTEDQAGYALCEGQVTTRIRRSQWSQIPAVANRATFHAVSERWIHHAYPGQITPTFQTANDIVELIREKGSVLGHDRFAGIGRNGTRRSTRPTSRCEFLGATERQVAFASFLMEIQMEEPQPSRGW